MAVTLLKFKIDPEKIPLGLKGRHFEIHDPNILEFKNEPNIGDSYYGWILFHKDGTIEIGEPGE